MSVYRPTDPAVVGFGFDTHDDQLDASARQRRHYLGHAALSLVLPLIGLPAGVARAQSATAALPPPNRALAQAQVRLDAVTYLRDQAQRATRATQSLQWQLERLATNERTTLGTEQAAIAALNKLQAAALPALHQAHRGLLGSAAEAHRRVIEHHSSFAAVAQAAPVQRALAMTEADARMGARAQAERQHRQARRAEVDALAVARWAVVDATGQERTLRSQTAALAAGLGSMASEWSAVHQDWQVLQREAAPAITAGWFSAAVLAPTGLPQARAPWAVPRDAEAPPDQATGDASLVAWQAADVEAQRAQDGQWLCMDAAAFVQRTLTYAEGCAADACAAWQQEYRALAEELALLQATLSAALSRQAEARVQADALPDSLQTRLSATRNQHAGLSADLTIATGPATVAANAAAATAEQALNGLEVARQRAEDAWIAAWQAQYGQPPPVTVESRVAPAPAGAAPPRPAPAPSRPPLEYHALHRLHQRNDEPNGFGAYTYVLVGTSVGNNSAGVHQRLQRLLSALRNLTPADQVNAAQRLTFNLFVVPSPAGTEGRPELVYDLRLGQSLMCHVPPGLNLGNSTGRALVTGNGPFLVTLPGRLSDALADWPLLFADLSNVPDVVVVDVVRSYMGDLLGQFNPRNPLWQPPALQQVALTLVRLVRTTGDLVQAVYPAALATPARSSP